MQKAVRYKKMNSAKWIIFTTAVYFCFLPVRGTGKQTKYAEGVKLKKSDKGCDKGKCKGNECECCPGYGVKESGLLFKSYSCEKCNCGEDFGCSFGWLGKTCTCPAGYIWDITQGFCRSKCSQLKCLNNGNCVIKEGNPLCSCTERFTGDACQIDKCSFIKCKNNGKCVIKNDKPVCDCMDKYTGNFCETDKCSQLKCLNNGYCVIKKGKALCSCIGRYTGDACQKEIPCFTNPCKNGGICIASGDKEICQCPEKFTGEFCEEDKCSQLKCLNNGRCLIKEGKAVCKCPERYIGDVCQIEKCSLITCENNGKCIIKNGKPACDCLDKYTGIFCETDKCSLITCKNNGRCVILNKKAVCNCTETYTGDFCETEFILLEWFQALSNFVVLTLMIGFNVLKWTLFFLYYLFICICLTAITAVEWLYFLIYNGGIPFVICWLTLPIILKIDYKDYFLLWYWMGRLSLNKLQECRKVPLTHTVKNPKDNYNTIYRLLKKIFELETDHPSKNMDDIALKDFLYHCPICLGSQIEIFLDTGNFYTMKCGHIYCNRCIGNMEGTTTVTCAVCKEMCQRESFQKVFLL